MKQTLIALLTVIIGVGLTLPEADAARRLGGGGSSGMQRSQPLKRDAAPSQNAAPTPAKPAAAAPAQSGASRWLGPLAGLAAGIGLAALFSHLGLGEEFSSIVMLLLIAAAIFFVFRLLLRRAQPQAQPMQYAGGPAGAAAYETPAMHAGASGAVTGKPRIDGPAGFDPESFVHHAKLNFLRLQAANDARDIEDIRTFTTPEMFAVVKLQMQERGDAPQKTDVVTLNAELLDVVTEFRQHIASVRFTGAIRETAGSAAEAFDEIWHITMPIDESRNWAIAGIQQSM
jgi:predicted lipid-binding transport protein (Tim44 family)